MVPWTFTCRLSQRHLFSFLSGTDLGMELVVMWWTHGHHLKHSGLSSEQHHFLSWPVPSEVLNYSTSLSSLVIVWILELILFIAIVCSRKYVLCAVPQVWRLEDNFMDMIVSFSIYMGSEDQSQAVRLMQ